MASKHCDFAAGNHSFVAIRLMAGKGAVAVGILVVAGLPRAYCWINGEIPPQRQETLCYNPPQPQIRETPPL